jgi:uncharacterized protein YqgC (DUF456 family)
MFWAIIQLIFGVIFILTGIAGLVLPIIPGILLIVIGISLVLHISLKNAWKIFKKRVLKRR